MLLKKPAALAALLLICILSFQNCDRVSPKVSFLQGSKLSNQESEGGAQPYDGKIFVLLGDSCPDQTPVHSKIILDSETSASLVREKCQDLTPVELGPADFQWSAADANHLTYKGQTFDIIGTPIDVSPALFDTGYAYWLMNFHFGTPPDSALNSKISKLQLYENGRPLGPAHSLHQDIRELGLGRFSHWSGGTDESLRFSASDNTDPRTNGRIYTYEILSNPAP